MKISLILVMMVTLLMTGLTFFLVFNEPYVYRGMLIEPPRPAPELALTNVKTGQPFQFEQERGTVSLLSFGYTYCPDVCPTTLGVWRQIKQALGPEAEQVRFIFVTVDPERDTPDALARYMRAFDETFIVLHGDSHQLEDVIAAYHIWVEQVDYADSAGGYAVNHTASTFLIDPDGALRVQYPLGTQSEAMVEDIRHLLP